MPPLHAAVLLLFLFLSPLRPHPDAPSLLAFKSSATDPGRSLSSWSPSSSPCSSWSHVSCLHDRVLRLSLSSLNLSGPLLLLTANLPRLRLLSLSSNRFSGPLPSSLSNLPSLRLLFLSHNSFSGPLPSSLPSSLLRLDLSHNCFSGSVLGSLNQLKRLLTLRLEANRLSGSIAGLNVPNLQDFNVSGNNLSGEIPKSLSAFPYSAFYLNKALCGPPLGQCWVVSSDPTPTPSPVVSSFSASVPDKKGRKPIGKVAVVLIVVADFLVLVAILLMVYRCFWRKTRVGGKGGVKEGEKIVYSSGAGGLAVGGGGVERGKMVFFEGAKKRFELEDLLRASAEMIGKGGSGTAYKAVMEDGDEVAVKRIKDGSGGKNREFEQTMEVVGRLRHGNLVDLKAYYFARDEKLLVYEYMPNGSLFWLLHGNRGPCRTPLDWTTRLKIVADSARGLTFIHNSSCKLTTHGNIKSTNILLDKEGNARVSDFGLSMFSTTSRSNGYFAPESTDGRKMTQKADVYSFGVLLLELLTGKCPVMGDDHVIGYVVDLPRWVQSVVREEWTAEVFDLELMRYKDIEEEMVGLLQIAMACTSAAPDQRPKMAHVLKMIEEIRGIEASPSHDASDSASEENISGVSQ